MLEVEYVSVEELQRRADELVHRATAGEDFGVLIDGRVVAWLVPPADEGC